jgi:hypothetical protein
VCVCVCSYAVFNKDKTLAELKGFEMKRRGELKLVKVFQAQVFENFLEGDTLETCYEAVGKVANQWMDVLFSHGKSMADDDLLSLISCSNNMSKSVKEYGSQKRYDMLHNACPNAPTAVSVPTDWHCMIDPHMQHCSDNRQAACGIPGR